MEHRASEVTGCGVVSCLGQSVADFSRSVLDGRCAIADIGDLIEGIRFRVGAPIRDFVPSDHFDARTLASLDRFSQFATVAARQAWAEAGLDASLVDPSRIGVVIGTANAGIDILDEGFRRIHVAHGRPRPLTIPMTMGSAPASRVAREIGARGPTFGLTCACASSGHAILMGEQLIRTGLVDVVVVGGTDSCYCDGYLRAWDSIRVVSTDTCRPFSIDRSGLVVGEGAGILILERAGRAAARGARVAARFLGGGMNGDASDMVAPDPEGMAAAIRAALLDGGLTPDAVGYVNAHGTGTRANDHAEALAIDAVFGRRGEPVSVSSTKSMIGHAMGASGALEAIATIAALESGIIPPTANFTATDPDCPIDPTPNTPRKRSFDFALSNSFAFGGLNVSLAFGRAGD